jgi:O-acetyl-ADP-ribose deacetylase (regulator of RNase III)
MIEYKKGDLFEEDVEAIVNTVNCVGIMGRGLALQFKNKFPDNYQEYVKACKRNQVLPGKMFVYKRNSLLNPKYVINFPTKRHWRGKSRLEDIQNGLDDLKRVINEFNITSIAIPPLGSGLGGLKWEEVKKIIEKKLQHIDIKIIVYEPLDQKITKIINKEIPKMTPGRAALIGLMDRYLRGLMDPLITLLEIHKLMYFMQEAGEELRLNYKKAKYGPYAENLRHVMNVIEGHFIYGYEDGGDNPNKQIKLIPGVIEEAKKILEDKIETKQRFERVSNLVEGFETPFGLELLATVHWVAKEIKSTNLDKIISEVYNWNERKKQFTKKQIKIALDRLKENNYLRN